MAIIGINAAKSGGAATVVGQPITPELADYAGTTTHTYGNKSHRLVVNAPGAIRLKAQQVNYPLYPINLDTIRISTDTWHVRTKQRIPNPLGGHDNIIVARVFFQAEYPDGSVINNPPLDRRIMASDTSIVALNRPGLMIGDRMPRNFGSSQVVEILPTAPPIVVDNTVVDNTVVDNTVIQTITDEFADVIDAANTVDTIDTPDDGSGSSDTVFTTRNIAIATGVIAIAGLAAWAYKRQHSGNANMVEWSPTGYDPTWWR